MLYAHVSDSKNSGTEGERSAYGELGLGATVPHVTNLQSTVPASGGGGYSPLGTGGGQPAGQPGGGAVPIAGTVGSTYRPGGRTTSPDAKGKAQGGATARNTFQATAQGSRVSMGKAAVPTSVRGQAGSKSTGFPAGGLFGLDDDFDRRPVESSGLSGFFNDLFKGNIAKAFTPPGGDFTRIKPLDVATLGVSQVLPQSVRTAIRYAGMAPVTVATFGLLPAPVSRKMFGLSPMESKYMEIAQKITRGVAATVATAGAATWLSTPASAGSTLATSGTSLPAASPQAMFAAEFGTAAPVAFPAPLAASPLSASSVYAAEFAAAPSVAPSIFATAPSFVPAGLEVAAPGSTSWLAAHPVTSKTLGILGTTVLSTVAQKLLQNPMIPGAPGGSSGGTIVEMGGSAPGQVVPLFLGGGSGGGGSSESAPEVLSSPLVPVTLAGLAIAGMIYYRRKRKS
jgi:hypothetical protein